MPCQLPLEIYANIVLVRGRGGGGVATAAASAANNESKCQNILLIIRRKGSLDSGFLPHIIGLSFLSI